MKTLDELRHRISSVEDMQSVVSTMKTLAAARIRQFETAAEATTAYSQTVDIALQILLRERAPSSAVQSRDRPVNPAGLILLGTDQGFCGRFNELVAEAAIRFIADVKAATDEPPPLVLTIGDRLNRLMMDSGQDIHRTFHIPKSVTDINPVIQEIIPQIEQWQREQGVRRVELFHNRRMSAATYDVEQFQLMPLSKPYLNRLGQQPWQSRSLPIFPGSWQDMFATVIRQHLFLRLFRAFTESLASENASRIAAMQQAEKNITEKLQDLNSQFNQNRQRAITEELLDIMSGFEAVTNKQ